MTPLPFATGLLIYIKHLIMTVTLPKTQKFPGLSFFSNKSLLVVTLKISSMSYTLPQVGLYGKGLTCIFCAFSNLNYLDAKSSFTKILRMCIIDQSQRRADVQMERHDLSRVSTKAEVKRVTGRTGKLEKTLSYLLLPRGYIFQLIFLYFCLNSASSVT